MRGINRYGRPSQGVRVMNLREGDEVSAVALVVESSADEAAGDGATLPIEGVIEVDARRRAVADDTAEDVTPPSRLVVLVRAVRYSALTRERGWSEVE